MTLLIFDVVHNECYFMYVIEVPANILLEKFGEKFLDFCQDSGYDRILQVLGATPRDFLQVDFPSLNN